MSNNHAHFVVYILAAIKRRQKERETGKSSEHSDILTKFIEALEESSAKRFAIEAELEEKRREQERKHEERMMRMMMEFVCQMRQPQHNYPRPSHGSYGQSSPSVLSSPSASHIPVTSQLSLALLVMDSLHMILNTVSMVMNIKQ